MRCSRRRSEERVETASDHARAQRRAAARVREDRRALPGAAAAAGRARAAPSYEEIGAALGMPVGAIGPTRARCLDKLRRTPELAGMGLVKEAHMSRGQDPMSRRLSRAAGVVRPGRPCAGAGHARRPRPRSAGAASTPTSPSCSADSALERDALVAVRRSGAPVRSVRFSAAELTIDIEIRADGPARVLLGMLTPASAATIELESGGRRRRCHGRVRCPRTLPDETPRGWSNPPAPPPAGCQLGLGGPDELDHDLGPKVANQRRREREGISPRSSSRGLRAPSWAADRAADVSQRPSRARSPKRSHSAIGRAKEAAVRISMEARAIFGREAVHDRGLQRAGRFQRKVLVTVLLDRRGSTARRRGCFRRDPDIVRE